jgi:hypothetical protein
MFSPHVRVYSVAVSRDGGNEGRGCVLTQSFRHLRVFNVLALVGTFYTNWYIIGQSAHRLIHQHPIPGKVMMCVPLPPSLLHQHRLDKRWREPFLGRLLGSAFPSPAVMYLSLSWPSDCQGVRVL